MASSTLNYVLENFLEYAAGEHFTSEVAPHLSCDEANLIADLLRLTHQHHHIFDLLNAHADGSPDCQQHFSLGKMAAREKSEAATEQAT